MTPSRLYMQNQELDLELVFLVSSPSTPSSSADAPWSCELQEHQTWQNGLHTLDKEGLLLQDERCRSGCSSLPSICRLFHTFHKGTLSEPSANMFSVKLEQNVSVFLLWTIVVMCLFLNWAPSRVCFLCDCKGRCTFQKPFRNVRKDSSSVPGASCCSGRHIFFSRQKFFHTRPRGTYGS